MNKKNGFGGKLG